MNESKVSERDEILGGNGLKSGLATFHFSLSFNGSATCISYSGRPSLLGSLFENFDSSPGRKYKVPQILKRVLIKIHMKIIKLPLFTNKPS